jgi:hypothetical protein
MPNPIAGKMSQKMRFQLNNYYVTKTNYSRSKGNANSRNNFPTV